MYEMKVLDNQDFDNLPITETRGSDISDSLGFANKHTGRAYIRHTGIHDLDKYLINHELEELQADESTHEDENGIRHKKGPKFFKDIIGPALMSVIPSLLSGNPGGAALSGLFKGFQGFSAPAQRQQQNQFSDQFSGQQQGFSGNPFASFSGSNSAAPGGFGNAFSNIAGGSSSARLPDFIGSSLQSTFGSGLGNANISIANDINPELKQRVSGFYNNRNVF